jgi:UDP-2-acetamido-3-amino-2,3-dideoxy-glucuronate N-acetyltransferase
MIMDNDEPRCRIACIGAGYWGKNLVRNFNDLGALDSVCEIDARQREAVKASYPRVRVARSADQILSDPAITAVAIATPAENHGEMVRLALSAGKDVFVEKPLCLSVEEGEELSALAARKQLILMVGHLLWYHPAILKLKEKIDEGALGRILYIYSNRLNLGKIRREENILWSFAPHDISVILGLVGEMPDSVEAQGGNYLHDRITDVTVSCLSFPSGIKAHLFVSWLHPFKEQKLVVVGDRQMAVFDDRNESHKLVLYPHSIQWKNCKPVASQAKGYPVLHEPVEPLRAECLHFLECVRTRLAPRTDAREGLRVLTVLQRCQEALRPRFEAAPAPDKKENNRGRAYTAHESAFIDEGVEIGEGTVVWHVSHVMKGSRVGKNCRIGQNVVIGPHASVGNGVKIQNNVSVYQGVTLEDDVFCGPSMVFTNVINPRCEISRMDELRPTLVRRGATLGANCTIVCGVTIGQYAFVGAGAVVLKDVPDYALVVGNPARVIGWMCACGNRIRMNGAHEPGICPACRRTYRKVSDQEVRLAG